MEEDSPLSTRLVIIFVLLVGEEETDVSHNSLKSYSPSDLFLFFIVRLKSQENLTLDSSNSFGGRVLLLEIIT